MDTEPELAWRLLDAVPSGLLIWQLLDAERTLTLRYGNPAAIELTGKPLGELTSQRLSQIFPNAPLDLVAQIEATCRDQRARDLGRFLYRHDDDAPLRKLSGRAVPLGDSRAAVILESVAALDRAEGEAREVSKFLDSIIEQLPAMVFVKDADELRFVRFNRAGEELLGIERSALLGKNDFDLFPAEQAEFFVRKDREVLGTKALHDIPFEPIETPRGTRWLHTRKMPILDEAGEPRHLLGISLDITDQKRAAEILRSSHEALEQRVRERTSELLQQIAERERAERALARTEEQLRHSQKMEAIGRLAGGVAHDFNNLLSVVLGYSELALKNLPLHSSMRAHIEQINRAGTRAAELTRQLLAFSRRQVLRPRRLELNNIVSGLEGMLRRLVGEDIELAIAPGSNLACVEADPSQLEQVIMNLVVNARDAMPLGGKLSIETRNVELDAAFVAEHLGAEVGPHVLLAVSDSGVGMDEATLARIFEPFFTTKELGKGTGLGLSTVFGIVQQSGGFVWVDSKLGVGSTFRVYLPICERASEVPEPLAPSLEVRGTETILLVEDDAQVRALAATCLRSLGYAVLEAADPHDALERAAKTTTTIHLLLTDVVMPGMGGRVLAEELLELHPEMRVLFMSGYTDDAVLRHGVFESGMAFLQKPLTPGLLAARTREVLDAKAGELVPG